MILQAPTGHELVHQKPVLVFQAIPDQFHKIGMIELTQVVDFRLMYNRS